MTRQLLDSASRIIRALLCIDAANDFADYRRSAIPVPNGRKIGPVIGRVQIAGYNTAFFDRQLDIRDAHPHNFFSSRSANRLLLKKGITRVPDVNGALHTILPDHMIPGSWGFELIPGVQARLFNRSFRKGENPNFDQFSAATPEVLDYLQSAGVTDVYLVGHVKRICVGTTAVNLVLKGFKVTLVSDAVGDVEIPAWQDVLDNMTVLGVKEVSSADLIAQMQKTPSRVRAVSCCS